MQNVIFTVYFGRTTINTPYLHNTQKLPSYLLEISLYSKKKKSSIKKYNNLTKKKLNEVIFEAIYS